MSITLDDLLRLPRSPQRDELIDRERYAIRERYAQQREDDARRLSVAEDTRRHAETILRSMPREPDMVIQARCRVLENIPHRWKGRHE